MSLIKNYVNIKTYMNHENRLKNMFLKVFFFLVTINNPIEAMIQHENRQEFVSPQSLWSKLISLFKKKKSNKRDLIEVNLKTISEASQEYLKNLYPEKSAEVQTSEEDKRLLEKILIMQATYLLFYYDDTNDLATAISDVITNPDTAIKTLHQKIQEISLSKYKTEQQKTQFARMMFYNSFVTFDNDELFRINLDLLENIIFKLGRQKNIAQKIQETLKLSSDLITLRKEPEGPLNASDYIEITNNQGNCEDNEIERVLYALTENAKLEFKDYFYEGLNEKLNSQKEKISLAIACLKKYLKNETANRMNEDLQNGLDENTINTLYELYNDIQLNEEEMAENLQRLEETKKALFIDNLLDDINKPEPQEPQEPPVPEETPENKATRIGKNVENLCDLIKYVVDIIHNDYVHIRNLSAIQQSILNEQDIKSLQEEIEKQQDKNPEFAEFAKSIESMQDQIDIPQFLKEAGYENQLLDPIQNFMITAELYQLYQQDLSEEKCTEILNLLQNLNQYQLEDDNDADAENINRLDFSNVDHINLLNYFIIFLENKEIYMEKMKKYVFVREIENITLQRQNHELEEANANHELNNSKTTNQQAIEGNQQTIGSNEETIRSNEETIKRINVFTSKFNANNYKKLKKFIKTNKANIKRACNERDLALLMKRDEYTKNKTIAEIFYRMPSLHQNLTMRNMIILIAMPFIFGGIWIYLNQDAISKMLINIISSSLQKELGRQISSDTVNSTTANMINPIFNEIDYTVYMQIITGVFAVAVAALITYMVLQYKQQSNNGSDDSIINNTNVAVSPPTVSSKKNLFLKITIGVIILASGVYYVFFTE